MMEKMARSEQLQAVTHPEILVLFEDWLEELEREVLAHVRETGLADEQVLADATGISLAGARFLIAKLEREGKI